MSLMSDQAKQSFRKHSGKIHCQHCGHEGPSKIERRGPLHYVLSSILLVAGLLFFWPLMLAGAVWLVAALVAGDRQVCMQCNSDNHLDLDYYQSKS